jgi:ketosteroid isomerase-like protein
MIELIAEGCEWHSLAGQHLYKGPEGVREYVEDNFGSAESVSLAEYTIRDAGDSMLVSGALNEVQTSGAIAQRQVHWLIKVTDGKVVRAQSFIRREDAEAAARASAG